MATNARPGDMLRVRLDWQLAYAATHEVDITLRLLDPSGKPFAVTFDKLPTEDWHAGHISTYHALVLPNNTPEGSMTLELAVAYSNGDLGTQNIATVTVVKTPAP